MESSVHRLRGLLLSVALLVTAVPAAAQGVLDVPEPPRTPAEVRGRVSMPVPKGDPVPVSGVVVTLHRVGSDSSGALDSVRTGPDGRYGITYTRFGGDGAIYFATAMYRGIAYFSAPLASARVSGEDGEITVYDTTTAKVDFHVQGHHLVVSAPRPDGVRDVVEVWELSNDKAVTAVGRDSLTPVWSAPLPRGAINLVGGEGDVSRSSIADGGARAHLVAAFGPGVKQLSYSYSLPPSAFPLALPLEDLTGVLEVLVEEPLARVSGGSLAPTDAATTGGRTFKRFLGQNAPPGDTIRIDVPATTATARTSVLAVVAAVIGLAMIVALVVALRRKRADASVVAMPAPREDESLLAAIAALDARRERGDPALDAETYAAQRAELKSRLALALAASTPPR